MELVLINGERVHITRKTCGYGTFDDNYVETSNVISILSKIKCTLNINPVKILFNYKNGFFLVGDVWNGDYDKIIPVTSVLYIETENTDCLEWKIK